MSDQQGGGSTKTVLIALGANALIAVAKGVGGVLTGSSALLSEAAHSVADTMNELFLFVALRRADRPADEAHPFGYGKARFFWSLLAAFGIFVAGGMFSFFEGYRTLTEPSEGATSFVVAYVVLGLAFVAEGVSFLRAVRQLRGEARAARRGGAELHLQQRRSDGEDGGQRGCRRTGWPADRLHRNLAGPAHRRAGLAGDRLIRYRRAAGGCRLQPWSRQHGAAHRRVGGPRLRRQLTEALLSYDEVDEVVDLLTMRIGTRRLLVAVRLDFARLSPPTRLSR